MVQVQTNLGRIKNPEILRNKWIIEQTQNKNSLTGISFSIQTYMILTDFNQSHVLGEDFKRSVIS